MKTFDNIRNNTPEVILEALDTPLEFYLTDDTKLPMNISAAFEIDDTLYGMSLLLSNIDKVYEFRFYKINQKKPSRWKFVKSSHVRPALSTMLKFMEMAVPMIKAKCDAIIIPVDSKFDPKRFNGLAQKVILKSYIKSFRYVPVLDYKKDKNYNFMFIVRKPKTPQQIFTSKTFQGYSWPETGEKFSFTKDKAAPADILANVEPKFKAGLATVSTKPSSKYQFKDATNISAVPDPEPEVVDYSIKKTFNVVEVPTEGGIMSDELVAHQAKVEKIEKKSKPIPTTPPKKVLVKPSNLTDDEIAAALIDAMPKMAEAIKEYGFDETKFNQENFAYVLKNLIGKYEWIKNHWAKSDWTSGNQNLTPDGVTQTKYYLKLLDKLLKDPLGNSLKTHMLKGTKKLELHQKYKVEKEEQEKAPPTWLNDDDGKKDAKLTADGHKYYDGHKLISTKVDTSVDFSKLKSTVPGSADFVPSTSSYGSGVEPGEEALQKGKYLKYTKGWDKINQKDAKGISGVNWDKVYAYTGSTYKTYNAQLRSQFDKLIDEQGNLIPGTTKPDIHNFSVNSGIVRMYKAFEEVEPFDDNIWVYRGADIPEKLVDQGAFEPGNDYVDPGFLSTSYASTNNFGMGNTKMRIFVPKGSKILPVIDRSKCPGENEIILPACSVLRIVKWQVLQGNYKTINHISAIYKGTIFPALYKSLINQGDWGNEAKPYEKIKERKYFMDEAKKPGFNPKKSWPAGYTKQSQKEKFGGDGKAAVQFTKKATKALQKGNIKITKS